MVGGPPQKQTSALPLALASACVVVYASLYPFSGWRDQGLWPLDFLGAPWPRYWTGFDLVSNLLGLGLFLVLVRRWHGARPKLSASA